MYFSRNILELDFRIFIDYEGSELVYGLVTNTTLIATDYLLSSIGKVFKLHEITSESYNLNGDVTLRWKKHT